MRFLENVRRFLLTTNKTNKTNELGVCQLI